MKKLYLVRHAKSSWNFDELDDFDRPLGKRGRRDVIRMGQFVKDEVAVPDLIVTSGASRAFYTALHLADHWKYPEEKIIISDALYHAGVTDFENILREVNEFDTVAVFGHNPGLTMFHNRINDDYIDNIPTCGMVGLKIESHVESWKTERLFYQVPKEL